MPRAIIGLGNPGSEYANTRHNAGFHAVDALARELGATYWKTRCGALLTVATYDGEDLILAKPQAFMNLSGGPVKRIAEEYTIEPADILIIHDELDLEPGDVRVKRDGGHAGHNGLRSIHEKLETNKYPRVRVGIGRPPGRMSAADYVLQEMRGIPLEEFLQNSNQAAEVALYVMDHGVSAAMDRFNGSYRLEQ
jgi:peptidyl-tRNA hydrolase, PTH1 family